MLTPGGERPLVHVSVQLQVQLAPSIPTGKAGPLTALFLLGFVLWSICEQNNQGWPSECVQLASALSESRFGKWSSMSLRQTTIRFIFLSAISMLPAWAQRSAPSGMTLLEVDVQLRFPDGSPGPAGIHILLENAVGGTDTDCQTVEGGKCRLQPSGTGIYTVSLNQSGYAEASQRVELVGSLHAYVTLSLRSLNGAEKSTASSSGPPGLAPKAQKELTRGLQELASAKPADAQKHFEAAARLAPNHPDVNYLLGLLAAQKGNRAEAQRFWEKAVSFDARHALSLTALGETYLMENNLSAAKDSLEKAVNSDTNSWRAHQLLAMALVKQHSYAESAEQAQRALEVGKSEAIGARLVLAEAFVGQQQLGKAIKTLQDMLALHPSDAQTAAAKRFLAALEKQKDFEASLSSAASSDGTVGTMTSFPLPSVHLEMLAPTAGLPKWFPANVDDSIPPVEPAASCPLQQITRQVGQRVQEFVHEVDRFTATESLNHESLNHYGLAVRTEKRTFNYMVSIQEIPPGILDVQEFRDGSTSLDVFPENIATLGMASLVLLFHPTYVSDYDLRCEGLSQHDGRPAWQVHFSQKTNKPGRLRSYSLGNRYFRVGLKGRAWISTDTFQVVRMETDLVKQVPDIRLYAEHQTVEYGPVPFQQKNVTLWLPFNTELYLDYNGHRIHRRHGFTNYLLFSVDERQKIKPPPQPATETNDSGL